MRKAILRLAPVIVLLCGCAHEPADTPPPPHLVYVIPGINGGQWSLARALQAFRDAEIDAEFRVHEWGRMPLTLANLTNYEGNRLQAQAAAAELAEYRRSNPTGSIDILGYSGGGGMAVMIAEELPAWVELRRVVLVQPALSPDYDLSAALAHVSDRLFNLYSPNDWLILGLGTQIFGTMDRVRTDSAGRVGFEIQSDRLEQRPWELGMISYGHLGNHGSIIFYGWNKKYVAPLLCGE